MDLNKKPEPTRRLKALYENPTPSGYEPPILGAINQMVNNIQEQRDNAIMVQIREQIGVNVDKNELIRALNYDRNQFNEGYRKGYRDATEKYEEADRWIPVSERVPDKNIMCLVSLDFGDVDIDSFIDGNFVCYHGNVTHWKPLPEHYTESDVNHRIYRNDNCPQKYKCDDYQGYHCSGCGWEKKGGDNT